MFYNRISWNHLVNYYNITNYKVYSNRRDVCYVNNTSTSLYEDGSETYPFKTLQRAINFINCSKYKDLYSGVIRITGGNNYILAGEGNKNYTIDNNSNGNVTISIDNPGSCWFSDGEIKIIGSSTKHFIINVPDTIWLSNVNINFTYCDFVYTGSSTKNYLIEENSAGTIFFNSSNCTIDGNNKIGYIINTSDCTWNRFGFTTVSNLTTNYYYRCVGWSFNIIPYNQTTKVTDNGSSASTILKSDTKILS